MENSTCHYSNHTRAHTVILGRLTTRKIPQKAIPHGPESPVGVISLWGQIQMQMCVLWQWYTLGVCATISCLFKSFKEISNHAIINHEKEIHLFIYFLFIYFFCLSSTVVSYPSVGRREFAFWSIVPKFKVLYRNHAVAPPFVCVALVRTGRSANVTEFCHPLQRYFNLLTMGGHFWDVVCTT